VRVLFLTKKVFSLGGKHARYMRPNSVFMTNLTSALVMFRNVYARSFCSDHHTFVQH
jgi:hypothetical protein